MWFKVHVTNRRVYQNLVYRKELFVKKSFTGVPSLPPLPYAFVVVVVFLSAYIFLRLPHDLNASGAHQLEPSSPLISWVNPFPSRFIIRAACFPRKVSYFRESHMSPWKKLSWMKSNSEARPSTVFLFYYASVFTVLQPLGSGMK